VQTLTITAVTRESARGLCEALSAFDVELFEGDNGPSTVEVRLGGGDREVVDVLNAIERHVTERKAGPAMIRLNEHDYTLHAPPHPG
jgi:hypothetical protein